MKSDQQYLRISIFILLLFLVCSCTDFYKPTNILYPSLTLSPSILSTSISTVTPSASIVPTKTFTLVLPTSTISKITETDLPTPVCDFSENGDTINLLHDNRIFWTDCPRALVSQIQERLEESYPEFSHIQQSVYYQQLDKTIDYDDALTIIWQASGAEIDYVNPFVVLVTVGESLNWTPPSDGDLYNLSKSVRLTLIQHYRDYSWKPDIRSQNPNILNASTYMIYAYFESNIEDIEQWCKSYLYLTGQNPAISPLNE